MAVTTRWEPTVARAAYRATMRRCAAAWSEMDVFDKPSLQRVDIRAADRLCQAAWQRQDLPALVDALARWESAICRSAP